MSWPVMKLNIDNNVTIYKGVVRWFKHYIYVFDWVFAVSSEHDASNHKYRSRDVITSKKYNMHSKKVYIQIVRMPAHWNEKYFMSAEIVVCRKEVINNLSTSGSLIFMLQKNPTKTICQLCPTGAIPSTMLTFCFRLSIFYLRVFT